LEREDLMKRYQWIIGLFFVVSGCVLESNGGTDAGGGSDSGNGTDSACSNCSDSGSHSHGCHSASDCDDGNFCNGSEVCAEGDCVPGDPPNCDDGVACTSDSCSDASGGCIHATDDGVCRGESCVSEAGGCVYLEKCNGWDDDLDGETDEGLIAPCETVCGTGEMLCVGGVYDLATCTTAPVPESCDGLDSDCDGMIDEGCVAPCSGTNIVAAGSFEGTLDGWLNEVHPDASASFAADCSTATDGACSALLDTVTAGVYYDVQLKQIEVPVVAGDLYQLCLMLKAEVPRTVVLELVEDDEPWATGGLWELVSIDETWREVCFTFGAMPVDGPYRLAIEVGEATPTVWADDVRLRSCP
jgi:hypothetical protein